MINPKQPSVGVIGLGKMGAGIVRHALSKGYRVVGLDKRPPDDLHDDRFIEAQDVPGLGSLLPLTRIVFLYVPAGPVVDSVLGELGGVLSPGDIVVDGGNSYWGDSIRRHARLKEKGIHFVDAGTSGGPGGALQGACFMVGGEEAPIAILEPSLRDLVVAGCYVNA